MNEATPSQKILEALSSGDESEFKTLLERSPELASTKNNQGISLLMLTLYHQKPALTELVRPHRKSLSVHEAAAVGELTTLKEILGDDGSALSSVAADGFTPLHLSCYFGREPGARWLLEHGADPNSEAQNGSGLRPIHSAAASRSLGIVRALLDCGANPNAVQNGGFTALMAAAMHGDNDVVAALLAAGSELDLKSDEGKTASDMAKDAGYLKVSNQLSVTSDQ